MVVMLADFDSSTPQELRESIHAAELLAARVRTGGQAEDVLALFGLLDQIAAAVVRLDEVGVDLRAELSRIETVHSTLLDQASRVVRAMGGAGELAAQRAQANVPDDRWWWYLDQHVAASRQQRARRTLWTVTLVSVILAILVVAYVIFLRPDEATRLRFGYVSRADSLIEQGDYEAALAQYREALDIAPDDPEINLMIGMMSEALGRSEDAAEYYARAEALFESRTTFLAAKSQRYSVMRQYEEAEQAALEAIELDDQYAWTYCNLGGAYEGQGRIGEAISALQTCSDLAREQGQDELYVIAASRMAMLMQMPLGANEAEPQDEQRSE